MGHQRVCRCGCPSKVLADKIIGDYIQESVVVLFGRLARHLDASDARIPTVVDKLVDALSTPAEQVQIAVSECLAPLVAGMEESKVSGPGRAIADV